jgi:hypothetical protein
LQQRRKTFIVGAGASAEFSLPTGSQLVSQIEQYCDLKTDSIGLASSGDRIMWRAIEILSQELDLRPHYLAQVALDVRRNMGLAPSIDNFLNAKQSEKGWAEVGKLAIARAILQAERFSGLALNNPNHLEMPDFARLSQNWLVELFRILATRKDKEEFCESLGSCFFIIYNYDRVVEHFFHQAIMSYFNLDYLEVDSICRKHLNVVHVYGALGEVNCTKSAEFGKNDDYRYLLTASKNIKTFSEGVDKPEQIETARKWIDSTDVLVFLGFGFLPLNLRTLGPKEGNKYNKGRFIATSKGMSQDNLNIAKNIIQHEWFGGRDYSFEFLNAAASDLVWQHSYYLADADFRQT